MLIGYARVSKADGCQLRDLQPALLPRHWRFGGMAA